MIEYHVSHETRHFLEGTFTAPSYYEAILEAAKVWGCNPKHLSAVLASGYRVLRGF